MRCENCGVKKFLFSDAEEIIPGRDVYFCRACYQKARPFLEERNTYPTHVRHLEVWTEKLKQSGITQSGMATLSAYCTYLDRLAPKKKEPMAEEPETPHVTTLQLAEQLAEQGEQMTRLTCAVEETKGRLRLAIWIAATSGGASMLSLLACLLMLFGG